MKKFYRTTYILMKWFKENWFKVGVLIVLAATVFAIWNLSRSVQRLQNIDVDVYHNEGRKPLLDFGFR